MKISVVLGVFNEESNIKRCLESVKWADEIVIVDDGSTDNTVEIAKKYTDKIYRHKSEGYVEPTRNFGIEKAQGDWILLLDADEEIPPELAVKLQQIAKSTDVDYVWIPRKNIIFGKWIQNEGWWPDFNVRFFKKGAVTWSNKIHSKPEIKGEEITIEEREELAIIHHNYQTVSQFLEKLDRYTTIEADEFIKSNKNFAQRSLISHPMEEFLSRMFARKGYRDGYHGLVLSSFEAFSMQVVMAKVWEKQGFTEVEQGKFLQDIEKEAKVYKGRVRYWITTFMMEMTNNPLKKTILRTVRKLSVGNRS